MIEFVFLFSAMSFLNGGALRTSLGQNLGSEALPEPLAPV